MTHVLFRRTEITVSTMQAIQDSQDAEVVVKSEKEEEIKSQV